MDSEKQHNAMVSAASGIRLHRFKFWQWLFISCDNSGKVLSLSLPPRLLSLSQYHYTFRILPCTLVGTNMLVKEASSRGER